jgi:hypothetical protein
MVNSLLNINFKSLEKFVTCKKLFYVSEIENKPASDTETGYIIGELLKGNSPQVNDEKLNLAKIFKYKIPEFAQVNYNEDLFFDYNNICYTDVANIVEINNNITLYSFDDTEKLYQAKDSVRSLLLGMMLYKKYNKNIQIKQVFLKHKKISKYIMTEEDYSKAEDFLMENINRINNLLVQGSNAFVENKTEYCNSCPYCKNDNDTKIEEQNSYDVNKIIEDTAHQIILLEKQVEKLYKRLEDLFLKYNVSSISVDGYSFKIIERYKYKMPWRDLFQILMNNGMQPLDYIKLDDEKLKSLLSSPPVGDIIKELAEVKTFNEIEKEKIE